MLSNGFGFFWIFPFFAFFIGLFVVFGFIIILAVLRLHGRFWHSLGFFPCILSAPACLDSSSIVPLRPFRGLNAGFTSYKYTITNWLSIMEEDKKEAMSFSDLEVYGQLVEDFANLARDHPSNSQIEAATKFVTTDTLKQQYLFAPAKQQECYLAYVLTEMSGTTAIVFAQRCNLTYDLALMLQNLGMRAIAINGLMSQTQRLGALNKFTNGDCNILVCSDIASKGLEISSVDMVINYNIPSNWEDYIHRVGRAAKAGRSGLALAILNQYEVLRFIQLEKCIGKRLPAFVAQEEEVLLLLERVTNARRISQEFLKKIKDAGGEKREAVRVDEV